MRSLINNSLSPLFFVANIPYKTYEWTHDVVALKKHLMQENQSLQEKVLLQQAKEQQLSALEYENQELKKLLSLQSSSHEKHYVNAEVIYANTNDLNQQVVINKGKQDKIEIGQIVVDANGVIGKIISVDNGFSRVMLITDRQSAMPVLNVRNGMRLLAIGTSDPSFLELAHVPETADIKVGDVIISSEIGKQVTFGYKVGVVHQILNVVGERFIKVKVLPYANVNGSRYIIVSSYSSSENKKIVNNKQIKPFMGKK